MLKQLKRSKPPIHRNGFSLTEAIVTSAIIALIASVAYPAYNNSSKNARQSEAKATLIAIPPVISAFVDATGETPTTWDDLSSIAVVMTSSGPATGELTKPIILPNSGYTLYVSEPDKSIYTLTATNLVKDETKETENTGDKISQNEEYKDRYAVKSCFNISNGASDLKSGMLSDLEDKLNCG